MSSSRIASVVAWYRAHPLADAVVGLGLLAMLFSPGSLFVWADVLVCGTVLLAAVGLDRRTIAEGAGVAVPVPRQRRPAPDEVAPDVSEIAALRNGVEPTEKQLRALSDQDLCRAWRTSYVRLQRLKRHPGGTRTAVAAMAAQRARYLDELERRYPTGFAAWLAAGARAPSDPTRYLNRSVPRPLPRPQVD